MHVFGLYGWYYAELCRLANLWPFSLAPAERTEVVKDEKALK